MTMVLDLAELALAPCAHGLDERGITVVGEVEEGCRLAVLLAHEEHRQVRREEYQRRGKTLLLRRDQHREPLRLGTVADLVVVLRADDESLLRHVRRRPAVRAP